MGKEPERPPEKESEIPMAPEPAEDPAQRVSVAEINWAEEWAPVESIALASAQLVFAAAVAGRAWQVRQPLQIRATMIPSINV